MYDIDNFIRWFEEQDRVKREEAKDLRNIQLSDHFLDDSLVNKVVPYPFTGTVAAVDSGFQHREYLGLDIMLCRTVGALFDYKEGQLINAQYDGKYSIPKQRIEQELDERDLSWVKSLFRLKEEITKAISLVDKTDILILDGSLLPLSSDKPTKDSYLYTEYTHLISLYSELFKKSIEKEVLLLGITKDTRSKRLSSLLNIKGNDVMLTDRLLEEKERTAVFYYGNNSISKEVAYAKEIKVFYEKIAKDIPLRVEYLSNKSPDLIAGIIYSLSAINPNYSYPAILIDVDLKAMIPDVEMNKIEKEISIRLGRPIKSLRRERRPFR